MGVGTLTIDLGAIRRNWQALDAMTPDNTETGSAIKGNAYGLGVDQVAPIFLKAGVQSFFVADVNEAVQLRAVIGTRPEIYVFSGLMPGDEQSYANSRAIPCLNSVEQIKRFRDSGLSIRPAMQIDSGMNRLGLEPAEIATAATEIADLDPRLILSHLACANEAPHPFNDKQLQNFIQMTDAFPNARKSLSATGGIQLGDDFAFDVTRPGIGTYGGFPFRSAEPVVTLSVPVIQVRDVQPGESVGYSRVWIASRPSRIATVVSGYADGVLRSLAGKGYCYYAGDIPCPLVGSVSMDMVTVDVTDLGFDPESLDVVNATQTIDDLADACGTSGYEILTSLGARYERVYTGGE